jgi:hypothetical protein
LTYGNCIVALAVLLTGSSALAAKVRLAGVELGPCPQGVNCGGGGMVRAVPWHIKQLQKMSGKADADRDPYIPLKTKEKSALSVLADALRKPVSGPSDDATFGSLEVAYTFWDGTWQHDRQSNFAELKKLISSECSAVEVLSMSLEEDTDERYGLLAFDCVENGKATKDAVGVALRDGRPVRAYFGSPTWIYADIPDSAAAHVN